MATTSSERPRDANGRFVRRRRAGARNATAKTQTRADGAGTEGAGQIALLSVAIIVGIAGLAFRVLWVGALILLGILWGSLAAERQRRSRTGKSVVTEVVDVVVEQAKDVADSAQSNSIRRDDAS
jgi:Flp pilus assembly protein TadB